MIAFVLLLYHLIILSTQQSISYSFTIEKHGLDSNFIHLCLISTELFCIGTPYQCLIVQFDPGSTLIAILDTNPNKAETSFNSFESSTYEYADGHNYRFQKIIKCNDSTDRIKFGPIELKNGLFYYASIWNSDLLYSTIGLSSFQDDKNHPNFISKLTRHQYILEINDEVNGTVRFDYNITSNSTYIKQFQVPIDQKRRHTFSVFEIKKLIYANRDLKLTELDMGVECIFDETSRFIKMPFNLSDIIYPQYLNSSYCTTQTYITIKKPKKDEEYVYYLCPHSFILQQQFNEDLTFALVEGNLILKQEELFQPFDDDNMIFSIIFKKDESLPQWVIGRPILKNYVLDRDFDESIITLYTKIRIKRNENTFIEGLFAITIGVMVIGIGCIGVSLYKFFRK